VNDYIPYPSETPSIAIIIKIAPIIAPLNPSTSVAQVIHLAAISITNFPISILLSDFIQFSHSRQ